MSTSYLESVDLVDTGAAPCETPDATVPSSGLLDDDGFGPVFTNPSWFD